MRLTSVAIGIVLALAVVLALEFWGVTLRFNFGIPTELVYLSARALDTAVSISPIENGYDIQINWHNPYYTDYVELNLSFRASANVTLTFEFYEVFNPPFRYYVMATEYCYIRVPGYVYSPTGCSDLEVKMLEANAPTTATYSVIGSYGSYIVMRIRVNNWGSGNGRIRVRVLCQY